MADPHFWAKRPADSEPKDIINFADGSSLQYDPNTSPHVIEDLDPGEYEIYVSDGPNGIKRGPTPHTHKSAFWRQLFSKFAPDAATDHEFMNSNPVLRARNSSGAEQDFKESEIDVGDLASFANGGDATLETLYDKSGNGNHLTPPSQGGGPDVVQGGTVVSTSSGSRASDFSGGATLTDSVTANGPWTIGIRSELTGDGQIANVDTLRVDRLNGSIEATIKTKKIAFPKQQDSFSGNNNIAKYSVAAYDGNYYGFSEENGNCVVYDGSTWSTVFSMNRLYEPLVKYNNNLYLIADDKINKISNKSTTTAVQTIGTDYPNYTVGAAVNGKIYIAEEGTAKMWTWDGSNLQGFDVQQISIRDLLSRNGNLYGLNGSSNLYKYTGSNSWQKVANADNISFRDSKKYAFLRDEPYFYNWNGAASELQRHNITNGNTITFGLPNANTVDYANGAVWVGGDTYVKKFEGTGSPTKTLDSVFILGGDRDEVRVQSIFEKGGQTYFYQSDGVGYYHTFFIIGSRSEKISVPEAQPIVVSKNGSDIVLRAGSNEASTTFSYAPNSNGTSRLGDSNGGPMKMNRYVRLDRQLSQTERSSLTSILEA